MTRTKSTYLALLAVLLSPMAANAVPIQSDCLGLGTFTNPGDCTFDDSQGLYFLDMNFSSALTYNQIVAEMGAGGVYEGYRHATFDEVLSLVNALLDPDPDPAVVVNVYAPGTFDDAITLLGSTNTSLPQIIGITGSQSSSGLRIGIDFFASPAEDDLQIAANFYSDDGLVINAGHWLVLADPPISVPEPSTLALLSLGLLGLGLSGCRKGMLTS